MIQSLAMQSVRIGVVGAGLVACAVHLPLLRKLSDRFEVIGVADPDERSRLKAARRFGVPAARDHAALLDDVDALVLASPNDTHADIALDALAAGVHVLVEKPLALTLADVDRIVDARDASGLTVQVGYMKRFDPAYEALLADLPDGELRHITTATYDPGLGRSFGGRDGRFEDPLSDVFLGALIHDVNLVNGILGGDGPLEVVDAGAGPGLATGTVRLPGGGRWTLAWMHLPGAGEFRQEVVVYSDDGVRRLTFPAPYALHAPTTYTRLAGGVRRETASYDEAYERQLVHFHECITAGAACRTPPEAARSDIELLLRLFEAA